ncbi:hypothetical protein T492DRAFT_192120 [Pavlovales sp. CCMP2436]|nr:hypothetical protein T492DRAFT_192120 [Pavlovales sp. CCMP2436]
MHKWISKTGKGSFKYQFSLRAISLTLAREVLHGLPANAVLQIVCKRGSKVAETREFVCAGEQTSLDGLMSMICTLYREPDRHARFEGKEATLIVQLICAGRRPVVIGRATLDLAAHAAVTPVSLVLELQLFREEGAMAALGLLRLNVSSRWLKNYDEGTSYASARDETLSLSGGGLGQSGYASDASIGAFSSRASSAGGSSAGSDAGGSATSDAPARESPAPRRLDLRGGQPPSAGAKGGGVLGGLVRAVSFGRIQRRDKGAGGEGAR